MNLFIIHIHKYGGSCNTINDPYAQICVKCKVKNMHVKVFHLMSRLNETRFFVPHDSCECRCRLNENVCNSKQKWSHDKSGWECKRSINWSSWKKDYMWNILVRRIGNVIKRAEMVCIWVVIT